MKSFDYISRECAFILRSIERWITMINSMCNDVFWSDLIGLSRHRFGCSSEIKNSRKKWQSLFIFSLVFDMFSAVFNCILLVPLLLLHSLRFVGPSALLATGCCCFWHDFLCYPIKFMNLYGFLISVLHILWPIFDHFLLFLWKWDRLSWQLYLHEK